MNAASRGLFLLLLLAGLVVLIPWLASLITALDGGTKMARSSLADRLDIVGNGLTQDIGAYLGLGIRIDEAVGLDDYLAGALKDEEDVRAALIKGADNKILARYVLPGQSNDFAAALANGKTDWQARGLDVRVFPIAFRGNAVGQIQLFYDTGGLSAKTRHVATDFLVILVSILAIAFDSVLQAYREILVLPLRTAMAQDKRAAERSFDSIAALPPGGPIRGVIEAQNRLILALNDRYARLAAYLGEIRESSFNRKAPHMADRLARKLAETGRFAPQGLNELRLDNGDLFAGTLAFRAGALVAIAGSLAALSQPTGLLSLSNAVAAGACLAGLTASGLLVRLGRAPRLGAGALLSLVGLALLGLALPSLAPLGAGLVAMGAAIVSSAVPTGVATAGLERFPYAAAGGGVGAAIVLLDSASGHHWIVFLAALGALASLTHIAASRTGESGAAAMLSLGSWRKRLAALSMLPAWVMIGYWLIASAPDLPPDGDTLWRALGTRLWSDCFMLALGNVTAFLVLRRWASRDACHIAALLSGLLLAALAFAGSLVPFTGWGALAAIFSLGVLVTAGTMAVTDEGGMPMLAIPAGGAAGLTLAVLMPPDGGRANLLFLSFALLAVAIAMLVLIEKRLHHLAAFKTGGGRA